ncbi:hypothetical protein D9599_24775 [Roseomonas sp. KE2513]|uniref:C45 family autoproteolytic acyltransferase/hydolase n=1 Tax=Roseomonas sp. KE2513 TaxID=2479202 RepID=UPI001E44683F|nr:C45 family peptidase [Roseomonas sp. KE2513]MBI0538775.1 hypothetical protein [Roseomonas sp. KE2513]
MNSLSKPTFTYRRRSDRPHLLLDATEAAERGRQRASLLGDELLGGLEAYEAFFAKAGLDRETIQAASGRVIDDVGAWRPRIVEEMDGIASEAGVDPWQIAALNARTELLGMATNGAPGECSTLIYAPVGRSTERTTTPFGVQTWDWNEELNDYWHTQAVRGYVHDYVGITEHGILGKIGVNSAGLGLFLNILAQQDDGVGGIPVHLLAATILEEAATVEQAIELARATPIRSSTALTVVDRQRAVSIELSPSGVFEVGPSNGLVRLAT